MDVRDEHNLDEFDDGSTLQVMTDGSLRLRLGLMPPSWYAGGAFEGFEEKLARVLGVAVEGLDRGFFGITQPKADTIATLMIFLADLKRMHAR